MRVPSTPAAGTKAFHDSTGRRLPVASVPVRSSWRSLLSVGVAITTSLVLAACGDARRSTSAAASASPVASSPAESAPPHRTDGEDKLGKLTVPDVVLVNQNGEKVHLYSDLIQGRAAALSFVFTRCTTICPPIGLSFRRLKQQLGERAGKEVSLVSISIDPINDTPERLLAWGKQFDVGPGWTLLTGDKDDVDRVLRALTVYTAAKEDHAPIVLVGDDVSGSWVRAYALGSPTILLETVDRLIGERVAPVAPVAPPTRARKGAAP